MFFSQHLGVYSLVIGVYGDIVVCVFRDEVKTGLKRPLNSLLMHIKQYKLNQL